MKRTILSTAILFLLTAACGCGHDASRAAMWRVIWSLETDVNRMSTRASDLDKRITRLESQMEDVEQSVTELGNSTRRLESRVDELHELVSRLVNKPESKK